MYRSLVQFLRDDAGYVLSGELVLVCTITVLSLVVGLSNVSAAINNELNDVGTAFGRLNQTYHAQTPCQPSGQTCDAQQSSQSNQGNGSADLVSDAPPQSEG